MASIPTKDISKLNFITEKPVTGYTDEKIMLSAIMRIADNTEVMAGNFLALQREVEYYKQRNESLRTEVTRLTATNTTLRGHLTRLRKQLKQPSE